MVPQAEGRTRLSLRQTAQLTAMETPQLYLVMAMSRFALARQPSFAIVGAYIVCCAYYGEWGRLSMGITLAECRDVSRHATRGLHP
jgi:hypothetical protein